MTDYLKTITGNALDNTIKRFNLVSDFGAFPGPGRIGQLSVELTAILGGPTNFARLQLTWVDDDNQIIVPTKAAATIEIDPGDATKGSYTIDVGRFFTGIPTTATGIWVGLQLDAGSATASISLEATDAAY